MSGPIPTAIWPMEWRERVRRYASARAIAHAPGDIAARVLSLRERMKQNIKSKGRQRYAAAHPGRSV